MTVAWPFAHCVALTVNAVKLQWERRSRRPLLCIGRDLGSQPGAKVSITIMRPPLGLFERTTWPVVSADTALARPAKGPKLDISARMRGM
jgi:hypothetical protein